MKSKITPIPDCTGGNEKKAKESNVSFTFSLKITLLFVLIFGTIIPFIFSKYLHKTNGNNAVLVSGMVLMDGSAAPLVRLTFRSSDRFALATTNQVGEFIVSLHREEYRVMIENNGLETINDNVIFLELRGKEWTDNYEKNYKKVPKIYSDFSTTPLRFNVPRDKSFKVVIGLSSDSPTNAYVRIRATPSPP